MSFDANSRCSTREGIQTRQEQTKYLDSDPVTDDEFGSLAHERVGVFLALEAEKLLSTGGAIGVEGALGSGKSTVLEIARSEFERSKNAHFFVFDAWAHQSDPFKGAFLDSWITWLGEFKPKFSDYLDKKKGELRGKVTDKVVTTTPSLTATGLVLAVLSLYIFPVAILWVSPFAFSKTINVPWFASYLGAIGVVLPLVAVIVRLICWKYCKTNGQTWLEAMAPILDKHQTETKSTEIRNDDPSVNVFSDFFQEVWTQVRSEDDKVVLVIDNIDRLPRERIRDVWADIHAITSLRRDNAAGETFVVVIPYDPVQVLDALGNASTDNDVGLNREAFGKVFSRRLQISGPIATEWYDFFNRKFCQAVGAKIASANEYHLRRLLEANVKSANSKLTPRRIISYLNEVVAVYRQRGETIALPAIAAYVLNRENITSNVDDLATGSIPGTNEQSVLESVMGDVWQRDIAALHYGVDPDRAMQVLLDDRVYAGLLSPDGSIITRLSSSIGFSQEMRRVIEDRCRVWAQEVPDQLSIVAGRLCEVDCEPAEKRYSTILIGRTFSELKRGAATKVEQFEGLFMLVSAMDAKDQLTAAEALQRWIPAEYPSETGDAVGDFMQGRVWASFTAAIGQSIGETERHIHYSGVRLPMNDSSTCGAASFFCENSTTDFELIRSPHEVRNKSLSKFASELVQGGHDKFEYVLDGLMTLNVKFEDNLTDAIVARLQVVEVVNDEANRQAHLRALEIVQRGKNVTGQLAASIDDGTFAIVWEKCFEADIDQDEESREALAIATVIILKKNQAKPLPSQDNVLGNSSAASLKFGNFCSVEHGNDDLIENLATIAADQYAFTAMTGAVTALGSTNNLPSQIYGRMIENGEIGGGNLTHAIHSFGGLEFIVSDDQLAKLAKILLHWKASFEEHLGHDPTSIPDAFFSAIDRAGIVEEYALLFANTRKFLQSADAEQWQDALTTENDQLRLLRWLIGGDGFVLGPAFTDALLIHARALSSGEQAAPVKYADWWYRLPEALSQDSSSGFYGDLMNVLESSFGTSIDISNLIRLYPGLLADARLVNKPNVVARKIVGSLLSTEDDRDKELVRANAAKLKSAVKAGGQGDSRLVREAIEASGLGDEEKREMGRQLGVRVKLPKNSDED